MKSTLLKIIFVLRLINIVNLSFSKNAKTSTRITGTLTDGSDKSMDYDPDELPTAPPRIIFLNHPQCFPAPPERLFRVRLPNRGFVPAAKRKYGYFSLPVLKGDTFVALIDAKADRKQKLRIVHNLHFEPVALSEAMIERLSAALKTYTRFNQCQDLIFTRSNLEDYLKVIREQF